MTGSALFFLAGYLLGSLVTAALALWRSWRLDQNLAACDRALVESEAARDAAERELAEALRELSRRTPEP